MPSFTWFTVVAVVFFAVSCASPAEHFDQQALRFGLKRQVVQGVRFSHVIYRNTAPGALLHVYLDGDGLPWLRRNIIAADPTPRQPLLLELMALDPAPSLYLGRPCYHGFAQIPPCSAELWTNRRYGPEVVDSMAGALSAILLQADYDELVFIGYSGGGALAMLLAEHFPQTRAVLTVAGNLDPRVWASRHGYSPLRGSLNPAARPPLPPRIAQLHFFGGRDENIPSELVVPVVKSQPNATFVVLQSFDHTCCWRAEWPAMLVQLCRRLADMKVTDGGRCSRSNSGLKSDNI